MIDKMISMLTECEKHARDECLYWTDRGVKAKADLWEARADRLKVELLYIVPRGAIKAVGVYDANGKAVCWRAFYTPSPGRPMTRVMDDIVPGVAGIYQTEIWALEAARAALDGL